MNKEGGCSDLVKEKAVESGRKQPEDKTSCLALGLGMDDRKALRMTNRGRGFMLSPTAQSYTYLSREEAVKKAHFHLNTLGWETGGRFTKGRGREKEVGKYHGRETEKRREGGTGGGEQANIQYYQTQ